MTRLRHDDNMNLESCKSNLQQPYNSRTQHENCCTILKHVLKPTTIVAKGNCILWKLYTMFSWHEHHMLQKLNAAIVSKKRTVYIAP